MTRVLNALRKEPVSGDTRSVVVFVHGYGANGADLLGLADPLGEHLPDTLFVAPDAPEQYALLREDHHKVLRLAMKSKQTVDTKIADDLRDAIKALEKHWPAKKK